MSSSERRGWSIEGGSLDTRGRVLEVDGRAVSVEPKVFDLLAYLIEHAGRAVGRDELISAVWGSVDVSDAVLGQVVRKARKALGEDGVNTRIRTIVRFGYRWTGTAEAFASTALAPALPKVPFPAETAPISAPPVPMPRRPIRYWIPLVAIGAILIGAIAFASLHRASGQRALAVLPANVVGNDPADAWIANGAMALLRSYLATVEGAPLVAEGDVVRLAHVAQTPTQTATLRDRIQSGTGARWILETTVEKRTDTWTIRYTLWDGAQPALQGATSGRDLAQAAQALVQQVLPFLGASATHSDAKLATDPYARAAQHVLQGELVAAKKELLALSPDERAQAQVQTLLAEIDRRQGHVEEATARLEAVLREDGVEPTTPSVLEARKVLAQIQVQRRDLPAAELSYQALLDAAQHTRYASLRADALSGLAYIAARRQQYPKADEYYARARAIRQASGDHLAIARQEANEGVLALEQGHPLTGLDHLRLANTAFGTLGMRREQAMTLFDMAQASADRSDLSSQRAMLDAAAAVYSEIGDEYGSLRVKVLSSDADLRSGLFSAGLRTVEPLAADARRLGYPTVAAEALGIQGNLFAAQGNRDAAETALRASKDLYESEQADDGARDAAWALAEVLAHRGSIDEALATIDSSMKQVDGPLALADAAFHRGNVLAIAGRTDEALLSWRSAYAAASSNGFDPLRTSSAIALANALVTRGKLAEAEPLIGKIAESGGQLYEAQVVQARYLEAIGDHPGADEAWQRVALLRGERSSTP